ncbi:hypothetical protein B0H65DRAFT_423997 [Neurospora tetraspora]|uniref:Uncharacterized protein n=1 Tax=Neurospora tetraspora TaxID=94610 RepID=A0AAE0MT46_9PEZI|nr:hypothetical protein B0H65DRAFT_423997 [Neurospora tetraspora]
MDGSDSDTNPSDTSTFDFDQHGPNPTSNSEAASYATMLVQAPEDTHKLQKMSLELASTRMKVMKLEAADQTKEAVIQKLKTALEEERKRTTTVQDEALRQEKETIRRLREEYGRAVEEEDKEEHINSIITALKLEVAGLRRSLDLTGKHRDEAMSKNLDLQQQNKILRWALAEHKRKIEKLENAENKIARIETIFKASFKNAGTSLICINGIYDLEGSLQLLLDRDRSRAKELDHTKKQLLEARNVKPYGGGDRKRLGKWW